ncbi:MAG: sugar isomerase, partial [candidate division KSB1 bacterium]|nr:sugar isomerase [candidate division KSB1 bacterium]
AIQTEEQAAAEMSRIDQELKEMQKKADFALIVKPVVKVKSAEQAAQIVSVGGFDVPLVYAAGGWTNILETCCTDKTDNLIFLRHRSGLVYLWYEILHNRFLRKGGDGFDLDQFRYPGGMTVDDVVVDDYNEVLTKLRAIYGVRNFLGRRIVALGGASGWCFEDAPRVAREKYKLDIVTIGYDDLTTRIRKARADHERVQAAERAAARYLALPETELNTDKAFVVNAFVLLEVIKGYLAENHADIFTIMDCMGAVMPIAETTACLTLSLLNDEGLPAFCESDFNAVPAGILLHYISGKPVFLNDPTFPHHGMVTCAHCTAPRRMDGVSYAPTKVVTHFESDYGAAPKVELPLGTPITMVCPDAAQKAWVGFTGSIIDNPFLDICRSQYDIKIDGDWKKLLRDHRGFHWLMAVGDYSQELAFACRKIGVAWENVSQPTV